MTAIYHGASDAADVLAARGSSRARSGSAPPSAARTSSTPGSPRTDRCWWEPTSRAPNIADVGWPPEPPPTEDPTEILGEALCHAAHNGRLETVELLLRRGAPVEAIHFGLTASFRDLARHRSVVEKLVEHGADLAIRDGQQDGNPLDWARHMLEERRDDARAVETLRFLEQRCGA